MTRGHGGKPGDAILAARPTSDRRPPTVPILKVVLAETQLICPMFGYLFLLLFSFQFSFFLLSKLGLFLFFSFSFIFTSFITHI